MCWQTNYIEYHILKQFILNTIYIEYNLLNTIYIEYHLLKQLIGTQ